jgi:hypothetical protein
MMQITNEQVEEFKQEEDRPLLNQRQAFVYSFLGFAQRVAPREYRIPTGRILSPSGVAYSQSESYSDLLAVSRGEADDVAAAKVVAHRTGFNKWPRFRQRPVDLGTHVHAAEVFSGGLQAGGGAALQLAGAELILSVYEDPGVVLYRPVGAEQQVSILPESDAWEEMMAFAAQLKDQLPAIR